MVAFRSYSSRLAFQHVTCHLSIIMIHDEERIIVNTDVNPQSIQELVDAIVHERGSLAQLESWLMRLKEANPYFYDSDEMLHLEDIVKALRKVEEILACNNRVVSVEQMIEWVKRLQKAEGASDEQDAWLILLGRNLPHPGISDLIFYPQEDLNAEEIIEQSLSYQPLLLNSSYKDHDGPAIPAPVRTGDYQPGQN